MESPYTFRLQVLGRYPARLEGNPTAVTFTLAAGPSDHLVYAGTLTMAEAEWNVLVGALRQSLGDAVEIDDPGA